VAAFLNHCDIPFSEPPRDPDLVTVLVDCVIIPRDPVDGGDGSSCVLDLAQNTIRLQGAICDKILNEGAMRMDYIAGCPSGTP
jgi:hypothetical protein